MEHHGDPTGVLAGAADGARERVQRELEERAREEKRQGSGSTPTEDVLSRALELDEDIEWHAGEDAGEVPDREEE